MKKLYVYSTLTADVRYQNTAPGGADLPVVVSDVFVRGGAGVANDRLITPQGVRTEITEQDAENLRANPVFQLHEKNGFVQISEDRISVEKAVADMERRDESAPLVPADLPANEQPIVGDAEDDDDDAPPPPPAATGKRGRK